MEGIPIFYVMQPSEDDSINVFFLPPQYKSQNELKIKDVVTHFPLLNSNCFYHFRFHAVCDKDQKTWVDISNMAAKVPIVDNKVLLKVLQVTQPEHTRTFSALYKHGIHQDILQKQDPKPPLHPKTQPEKPKKLEEETDISANKRQNPPQNQQPTSDPIHKFEEFDLLGGDDEEVKVDITVKTTEKVTVSNNTGKNSGDLLQEQDGVNSSHKMSREELRRQEQEQMEKAIKEKLDFAKKIYQDAENAIVDRDNAQEELEEGIKKWAGKDNQRNNIRTLLCTLHEVVWKEAEWQALSFSDVMQPGHIKKHYWRAMKKFHPDQNMHRDYMQRYISERVTNELSAAFQEFRKTNP